MLLPVSGLRVLFRSPDGSDDLAILEAAGNAIERALAVLPRLVLETQQSVEGQGQGQDSRFWEALTVTDFEAALLGLRRSLFGDSVTCLYRDPGHACEVRMEVEFSVAALLEQAQPRVRGGVRAIESEPGWYGMATKEGAMLRFRLPSVGDQLQVMGESRAAALLIERCLNGGAAGGRLPARVERAMEALAPAISQPLQGYCPECRQALTIPLHVPQLVMDELCDRATGVHAEIDQIASAYHWQEAVILAMPQSRRKAYAEIILKRQRSAE